MINTKKKILIGNQAIAQGAWEAGVTVATAYPGTPTTEITEFLSEFPEINAEWSVNEKVALEIAIGASFAGARAICCMKHVGLNVAADPLMSLSYPGVNGGLVIVVADDPELTSSQNEQDTRYFGIAAKIPVLEPSDSAECASYIAQAFDISEEFDTPVIIRLTTRVAHSCSPVIAGKRRNKLPHKELPVAHGKLLVAPSIIRERRQFARDRLSRLAGYAESSLLTTTILADRDIGIISSGIIFQNAVEVFPDASFLKLGMVHPLPRRAIETFVQTCRQCYVLEELDPIIETTIRSWGLPVIGKDIFPSIGELTPEIIRSAICKTGPKPETPLTILSKSLPVRLPVLCPGCHHRGPFYVLKKLGLFVSGDIGCYSLAAFPPFCSMHISVCMGAGIGMAFGMEKALGKEFSKKSIAVIGDSTFWHSGITPLIDVVYNRGFTTVIILDNSVTAMTGHQQNPSSGTRLGGQTTPALNFEALVRAIGIRRVCTVDAHDLLLLEKVIAEEVSLPEPSVIITKKKCALIDRENAQRPQASVDAPLCTGCKKCLELGCPAITFKNNKAFIEKHLCAGCGLCGAICQELAISYKDDRV